MGKRLALLLVVVGAVALPATQPAEAGHGKPCGLVSKGSADYRAYTRGVKCRSVRKWVKRYLTNRGHPRGYSCLDPSGPARVYCSRGSRSYWAFRL